MAGNCKYYKREMYVSMDSGQTWSGTGVYSQGALIESASTDCGYVPPTPPTPSYENQYLTFRALEDTSFRRIEPWGEYWEYVNTYYSLDSGSTWTSLQAYGEYTPTIHSGETIMWKGSFTTSSHYPTIFSSTGRFEVEGNIMSLLYGDNFSGQTTLGSYEFNALFSGCTEMTSAENLVLPATTLAYGCYWSMFEQCYSLTTAPTLIATTLVDNCYTQMFYDCSSLNSVTCLATNIPSLDCTSVWLDDVASTGTFYCPSSTQWSSGSSGIPNGWTRVNI